MPGPATRSHDFRLASLASLIIHVVLLFLLSFVKISYAPLPQIEIVSVRFESPSFVLPRVRDRIPAVKNIAETHPSFQLKSPPTIQEKLMSKSPETLPDTLFIAVSPGQAASRRPQKRIEDLTFDELDSLANIYPLRKALLKERVMLNALKEDSSMWALRQRYAAVFRSPLQSGPRTARDPNRHPLYGTPYDPLRAHYSQNQVDIIGLIAFLRDLFGR